MKVLSLLVVIIASASAGGSGPYLPSGWRPSGPAFFLPSEVSSEKPSDSPLKDAVQESEASGSDSLREYGPPKVESQDITQQALPEEIIEQAFVVLDVKSETAEAEKEDIVELVTEANPESTDIVAEIITESQDLANAPITTQPEILELVTLQPEYIQKSLNIEIESESDAVDTTEAAAVTQAESENANSNIVSSVEKLVFEAEEVKDKSEEIVEQKEVQEVNNIAELLVNLKNEIKEAAVTEAKEMKENAGPAQVPEGFLEYGPPGFREYGPPKDDEILKAEAVIEASENEISNNDVRRRRFSPKFRPTRKAL